MKRERRPLSVESRWTGLGPGWVTRGIPRAMYHSFGLSVWKSTDPATSAISFLGRGWVLLGRFLQGLSHLEWRKYQGRFPFARTGQPTVEMKEGVGSVSELRRNYVGTDRAAFDPTGHPFRNRVIFARSSSQFDGTDTFRLRMNPLSRRSVLKNGMRRKSCRIGMVFTGRRGGRH